MSSKLQEWGLGVGAGRPKHVQSHLSRVSWVPGPLLELER